jgi:hypothetical protein
MPRSFINKKIVLPALLLFLGALTLTGCSKSDDQKKFENEALSIPNGITETDASGKVIANKNDPNDWRISPNYAGPVRIETPAYPNPTFSNEFRIVIYINVEAIPSGRIDFLIIDDKGEQYFLNKTVENVASGFLSIVLNRSQFAGISPNNTSGLYRILISDGRNNIITYGDVKIE